MRFLTVLLLLAVAGCTPSYTPSQDPAVAVAQDARSSEAAAAVGAAREVNRQQPPSQVTEVVERELDVAQANLPLPSEAQRLAALERANNALLATKEELSRLYSSAMDRAAKLEQQLGEARREAGRFEERERSKREALMLQTRITTWAAVGFIGAGVLFGLVTRNVRIAAISVVMGGILLGSARMIATVPDWAYTILFVTAGILVMLAPGIMFWAYKTGIFQKPPKKVGDYTLVENEDSIDVDAHRDGNRA